MEMFTQSEIIVKGVLPGICGSQLKQLALLSIPALCKGLSLRVPTRSGNQDINIDG